MENKMYSDRPCAGERHGFGLFLPLLIIPVTMVMMRKMAMHRFAHHQGMYSQGDQDWVPPMFAEFHRRAHAAEAKAQAQPPAQGPTATV